jgi:hypothetical protein
MCLQAADKNGYLPLRTACGFSSKRVVHLLDYTWIYATWSFGTDSKLVPGRADRGIQAREDPASACIMRAPLSVIRLRLKRGPEDLQMVDEEGDS